VWRCGGVYKALRYRPTFVHLGTLWTDLRYPRSCGVKVVYLSGMSAARDVTWGCWL
jgi:hypothetical protein